MFIDRAASTVIGDGANAFISDWNKITATVRNIYFTFEIPINYILQLNQSFMQSYLLSTLQYVLYVHNAK